MEILISNRIYFETSEIPPATLTKIKDAFRYSNPQYYKLRAMGRYPKIPSIIATFRLENGGKTISVPRGGRDKLLKMLADFEFTVKEKLGRHPEVELSLDDNFTLRGYQQTAVDKILENKICLIECAPAAGKTEIALATATKIGQKTGILVHSKYLFDQWVERIEKRLHIPRREIGKVGSGKFSIGEKITVIMAQTAKNHIEKLRHEFGMIFADEVHHYGATTFMEVVDSFNSEYRVGMTAKITRQDLKVFLIYDVFGSVVFSIEPKKLVDLGYTSPVELHIITTDFEYDYGNEKALKERLNSNIIDFEDLNAKEKLEYQEKYKMSRKAFPEYLDISSSDRGRNILIYRWVMRKYNEGKRIIIFTKRRNQCVTWQRVLKDKNIECAVFWGTNGKKDEEKRIKAELEKFKDGKIKIAIGTVLDEGIDIPIVDVGFITYRNAKNPGQLGQQAGRFARLFENKKSELYYFHDGNISQFSGDIAALKRTFEKVTVHGKEENKFKILRKKS